jgi:hypothetical protein
MFYRAGIVNSPESNPTPNVQCIRLKSEKPNQEARKAGNRVEKADDQLSPELTASQIG